MATNFGTTLTITRPPWKIIACCLHLPPIFGSGLSDDVVKIYHLLTPVAMVTNFWTKLTNSAPVKDNCQLFSPTLFFGPTLSDGVIWISPLATLVAMATNFETKIDYNLAPVKNNCALFSPTPLFSGPGYSMVSFKLLPCQPLLPWQRILGQKWLQLGPRER